ncbi:MULTISPECIES: sulfite exporter TauE/SafE family protein [unclassified Pseudomonas]|uniref:sulfite exporter TauE/SafE family protein n=1 Tax=unclassified Pseudomonas TaxID=196821 RepID=UPI002AC93F2F|nr:MULTISPECIES: sulfite exporter TauE/SafE family protein [unclassified Pseudomonas]MEB0042344.1 sulfite exporter TauE/SafE family protein [Pseudomonas sp. MH10]MEB0076977.1 sulfite exporter TauE/SafE family protein [Pseudomonas sp. MH10out]MEB0089779.1 sulfite exporter TauE/SafE family protein [Pseudomonas sp. CCI4.2]MEB0104411.1 sulfite exporter TauE/SafE family protein [Pseudomonas sp. CCI3.2]MEB0121491.1 sulfite exporter TauE/SafE family protein [Pseudomonas sp. CCI1.2]
MALSDIATLFDQLAFSPLDWLLIELGATAAYIVFGIAGFGTALIAGPILINFMSLSRIIPLLVLLDFIAAFGNLLPSRKSVVKTELLRLLPCMAIGCTVGVVFLLNLKSNVLLLLMGLFITVYALYSLLVKVRPAQLAAGWAIPMGTVGGLFGALFGSGGFLYAIYLNSRLTSKEQVRATQAALISCSTIVRLSLFLIAGVYADVSLLMLAACLFPAMVLGSWVGRSLTMKLSREAFVRLITWLVLASGIALIARYFSLSAGT